MGRWQNGNKCNYCAIINLFYVYLRDNGCMMFAFDTQKSESNKEKHGIDFHEAQYLLMDPERAIIPARMLHEVRYLMVARYHGIFWSVVYTTMGDVIRIISVRKSREDEKEIYQR